MTELNEFEYEQILRSYDAHLQATAKGISIYLVIVAACLTLPNTLNLGSNERNLVFREMCRMFASIVTIAAIILYLVASVGLWNMHKRARVLAGQMGLSSPPTWILPFGIWVVSTTAAILLVVIVRYT